MQLLSLNVPDNIAEAYKYGGQYLQMSCGEGKPAYMAMASPPLAFPTNRMEFLITDIPEGTAHNLCKTDPGSTVGVSDPMGKGFPVQQCPPSKCESMLIFATGSGIAPINALIEARSLGVEQRKEVRIYYGAHDEESMSLKDRIPVWEYWGYKVIKVLSTDGKGYVQDVYAKDSPPADPSKTCVLLCGQKEMAESVREICGKQGVPEEYFLTNF